MRQHPKSLVVLAGLPLSGKTTIGKLLSEKYKIPFLDIDETRAEFDNSGIWHGAEKEREIMLEAYTQNHNKAGIHLVAGKPVIIAATYSRSSYHDMLKELSKNHAVDCYFFLLEASEESVKVRLEHRKKHGAKSNINTLESYKEVRDRYQPYKYESTNIISTDMDIEKSLLAVEQVLMAAGVLTKT